MSHVGATAQPLLSRVEASTPTRSDRENFRLAANFYSRRRMELCSYSLLHFVAQAANRWPTTFI